MKKCNQKIRKFMEKSLFYRFFFRPFVIFLSSALYRPERSKMDISISFSSEVSLSNGMRISEEK